MLVRGSRVWRGGGSAVQAEVVCFESKPRYSLSRRYPPFNHHTNSWSYTDAQGLILLASFRSSWWHTCTLSSTHQLRGSFLFGLLSLPPPSVGPNVRFPPQFCADCSIFLQAHSSCIYLHDPCFFPRRKRCRGEVENMVDVTLC